MCCSRFLRACRSRTATTWCGRPAKTIGRRSTPQGWSSRRDDAIPFQRLVRSRQAVQCVPPVRKTAFQPAPTRLTLDKPVRRQKLVLTETITPIANPEALNRGIGEIAHAVDFTLRTAMIRGYQAQRLPVQPMMPKLAIATHRKPPGWPALMAKSPWWSGMIDNGGHRGEVMAADRERQQDGTADLPFFIVAMKTNGQRDSADRRAEHDRCGNKNRIPQDDACDFNAAIRCSASAAMPPARWAADPGPVAQFAVSDIASPARSAGWPRPATGVNTMFIAARDPA